jgi:hypothetical protein
MSPSSSLLLGIRLFVCHLALSLTCLQYCHCSCCTASFRNSKTMPCLVFLTGCVRPSLKDRQRQVQQRRTHSASIAQVGNSIEAIGAHCFLSLLYLCHVVCIWKFSVVEIIIWWGTIIKVTMIDICWQPGLTSHGSTTDTITFVKTSGSQNVLRGFQGIRDHFI